MTKGEEGKCEENEEIASRNNSVKKKNMAWKKNEGKIFNEENEKHE